MSLLRRLFVPVHEIEAELEKRFAEILRPEIDAVVHAADALLEHPHRLEEMRERAHLFKDAAGAWRRHHAEAHVRWLEVRAHAQVHKAMGLMAYGALIGAAALFAAPGPMGEFAPLGFAAAAWLAALCVLASLSVLWVRWPSAPGTLADAPREAAWMLRVLVRHALRVNAAVFCALAATLSLGAAAWGASLGY